MDFYIYWGDNMDVSKTTTKVQSIQSFVQLMRHFQEAAKEKEAKEKKPSSALKSNSGTVVMTNSDSIQKLLDTKGKIQNRISEIVSSDDSPKIKSMQIMRLNFKIDEIENMISQIRAKKREEDENKVHAKKDKKHTQHRSVTVSKNDLADKPQLIINTNYTPAPPNASSNSGSIDVFTSSDVSTTSNPNNIDISL